MAAEGGENNHGPKSQTSSHKVEFLSVFLHIYKRNRCLRAARHCCATKDGGSGVWLLTFSECPDDTPTDRPYMTIDGGFCSSNRPGSASNLCRFCPAWVEFASNRKSSRRIYVNPLELASNLRRIVVEKGRRCGCEDDKHIETQIDKCSSNGFNRDAPN